MLSAVLHFHLIMCVSGKSCKSCLLLVMFIYVLMYQNNYLIMENYDYERICFTRCLRSHGGQEVERMLSCHMFMAFCAHRRRKICSSLQIYMYICLFVHVHKNHMHIFKWAYMTVRNIVRLSMPNPERFIIIFIHFSFTSLYKIPINILCLSKK